MTDLKIIRPAVVSALDSRQSEKTVTCPSSATQALLAMASTKDEVSQTVVPYIEKLFERDGYLRQHEYEIRRRYREFSNLLSGIEKAEGNVTCQCHWLTIVAIPSNICLPFQAWTILCTHSADLEFMSCLTTRSAALNGLPVQKDSTFEATSTTGPKRAIHSKGWSSASGN